MDCPICDGKLEITGQLDSDGKIGFSINRVENDYNHLLYVLHKYWQWRCEGANPRYDIYHENMEWHPETKTYSFDIQVHDSPDGDTWWRGEFKVTAGIIQIIKQELYS